MKKRLLRYCIVFLSLIACYFLFMLLGCLIPDKPVQRNIARSVPVFMHQGDYPCAIIAKPECKMDNFTDALILNMTYHISRDSLKTSLLLNPYTFNDIYMNVNLEKTVERAPSSVTYYARYWHGSSFLMRFLLLFGNYEHIRQFLYVISMVLLLCAATLLYRETGLGVTLYFFSGFMLLHGFTTQMCLQFFPTIAIALVATIAICCKWRDFPAVLMIFFVAGSVTSFFDLFSTPLLTFGLPVLAYIALNRNTEETWGQSLWNVVKTGIVWMVAYATTWGTKWLTATLVTRVNVFQSAVGSGLAHSHALEEGGRCAALAANLHLLNFPLILSLLLAAAVIAFVFFNKKGLKTALICLLVSLTPYVWYFAVASHSYWHSWFTYRVQMIAVSGIFLFFACLTDWQKVKSLPDKIRKQ